MTKVRQWWVMILVVCSVVAGLGRDTTQAASEFSLSSIQGTYGVFFVVQAVPSLQPLSGIGVFTADGQGNVTGVATYNDGTLVCEDVAVSGTYTVNPNGTGTVSHNIESTTAGCSRSTQDSLAISNDGELIRLAGTSPGAVTFFFEWRKQHQR